MINMCIVLCSSGLYMYVCINVPIISHHGILRYVEVVVLGYCTDILTTATR